MVKGLRLTVLVEDSMSGVSRDLTAKHGLSFLIETKIDNKKLSVLMDTGPSSVVILHNADVLGVDVGKVDMVFLTHGHYDHTGGLIGLLKRLDGRVPVIAHPKIFGPKLKIKPSLRYIGPSFKPSEVEASGGLMLLARNPVTIAEAVVTSGEIERVSSYERVEGFWTVEEGRFREDEMPDDQALIVKVDEKGLAILSGCAHSGIINTIKQAQKVTGVDKIYAVLGGFHLKDAYEKRIAKTIKELKKIGPEIVAPCHCTGSKVIHRLDEAFKDHCRPLGTGDTIDL